MADVSVRAARPADAELVARVQLTTWRAAYADLLPAEALDLPLAQVAAVWLGAVEAPASPRHSVLVALEGDQVVGFLSAAPEDDEDAVEVTALLVLPEAGRRGHGSRLLAAAVDGWRTAGVTTAGAWVWERDAASRAFLTSAGWAADGASRGLDTGVRVEPQLHLHVDVRP